MNSKVYDVIVVGGGHAGSEAALAASRMGCATLLVTLSRHTVGFLSCNPAIGGVGKGQLVREIDALGGEMARATDYAGIQFRTLNASKGAAVHSSRAQVDRNRYADYMQHLIACQDLLDIYEAKVAGLLVADGCLRGIGLDDGRTIAAKTVILTPGTFLNGLMHIGMRSFEGGRIEEPVASRALSRCLRDQGLGMLRFKTGTCARLDGRSIDFSRLRLQGGDEPPRPFSFSTKRLEVKQVPCYITYTGEQAHRIVRDNLGRSPLFSGKITGTGVRYCPSFEDKVVKFPHHQRHQIFLEPEGLHTDEWYPNGLSTSLPEDVQERFIRSIVGLEEVRIDRFGYGIEHDVVDARELLPTLETKRIANLYLAGQINGTTGYEEAACQGLVAGINAALRVQDRTPLVLDRSRSYIGVLLDDLVIKGTPEPYRMFTSRVEYRLILREDNADIRLRKTGFDLGLVSRELYEAARDKEMKIRAGITLLQERHRIENKKSFSLYHLLKRPGVGIDHVKDGLPGEYPPEVLRGIEIEAKYAGFIGRQMSEVKNFRRLEHQRIPPELDYRTIPGLSGEIREKLLGCNPLNVGQASRISGMTPTALAILMVYIKKINNEKKAGAVL